jgi:hypothetical protein
VSRKLQYNILPATKFFALKSSSPLLNLSNTPRYLLISFETFEFFVLKLAIFDKDFFSQILLRHSYHRSLRPTSVVQICNHLPQQLEKGLSRMSLASMPDSLSLYFSDIDATRPRSIAYHPDSQLSHPIGLPNSHLNLITSQLLHPTSMDTPTPPAMSPSTPVSTGKTRPLPRTVNLSRSTWEEVGERVHELASQSKRDIQPQHVNDILTDLEPTDARLNSSNMDTPSPPKTMTPTIVVTPPTAPKPIPNFSLPQNSPRQHLSSSCPSSIMNIASPSSYFPQNLARIDKTTTPDNSVTSLSTIRARYEERQARLNVINEQLKGRDSLITSCEANMSLIHDLEQGIQNLQTQVLAEKAKGQREITIASTEHEQCGSDLQNIGLGNILPKSDVPPAVSSLKRLQNGVGNFSLGFRRVNSKLSFASTSKQTSKRKDGSIEEETSSLEDANKGANGSGRGGGSNGSSGNRGRNRSNVTSGFHRGASNFSIASVFSFAQKGEGKDEDKEEESASVGGGSHTSDESRRGDINGGGNDNNEWGGTRGDGGKLDLLCGD